MLVSPAKLRYSLPMLASATYATRRGLARPFARGMARQRRMGHKLSFGLTPAQVARLEGMGLTEVEALLAEPGFQALVDGYRALHAMPEEEQRRILASLARHLLMEAVALGDVRVATYVLLQERMGRDPALTLADGVLAASRTEPRPAPPPALAMPTTSPRPAYPSDDPDLRAMRRVEDRLHAELAQEHAAVQAAVAAEHEAGVAAGAEEPAAAAGEEGAAPQAGAAPRRAAGDAAGRGRPLLSEQQRRALGVLAARDGEAPTPRSRSP